MRCFASFALSLCLASTALAGIDAPETIEIGKEFVATVDTAIPEGATSDVTWKVEGPGTVSWKPLAKSGSIGIWVDTPGKVTVSYSGFWINLKTVKFKDGEGNDIEIQSYLGHGLINESVEVDVTGEAPGPDPPEPGPQPGKKQLIIVYDANMLDNLPANQRYILTSLIARKEIQQAGHRVLEVIEKSQLSAVGGGNVADLAGAFTKSGVNTPAVAFAPQEGGTAVVAPLPASVPELLEVLK